MPAPMLDVTSGFTDARAGYKAANRSSRFTRRRRGLPSMGADHDWHLPDDSSFIYLGEAARDADRNDVIIGQAVDRVVANTIQGGFTPNPDTGDSELDRDLLDRWNEESKDPHACDPAGQLTFHEQERMVLRDTLVVGDIFALPIRGGTVQLLEFHRCRSPHRKTKNNLRIHHGIEYENGDRLRRRRYWFTKTPRDIYSQVDRKDLHPVDAFDSDGLPNVWHHYFPKRPTQTRGLTAFAPIFDVATYHDDIEFALMLKQQLSAFFLLIRKRGKAFFENGPVTPGRGTRDSDRAVGTEVIDEIAPGMEFKLGPDEDVTPWSPRMPSNEAIAHLHLLMRLIACNLGCPLELLLLDGSMTNFSGWRGSMDQARMGFRSNQSQSKARFHRHYWRHKVRSWSDTDPALRKRIESSRTQNARVKPYKHDWDAPGFSYIEPSKDATADVIRSANGLSSPRRIAAERGADRAELDREIVEDRAHLIRLAAKEANGMNKELGLSGSDAVTWRDLSPLPNAERMQVSLSGETGSSDSPAQPREAA